MACFLQKTPWNLLSLPLLCLDLSRTPERGRRHRRRSPWPPSTLPLSVPSNGSAETPSSSSPSHVTLGAPCRRPRPRLLPRDPMTTANDSTPSGLPRARHLLQPTHREPLPPLPLLPCSFSRHGHRSAGDRFAPPPELLTAMARGRVRRSWAREHAPDLARNPTRTPTRSLERRNRVPAPGRTPAAAPPVAATATLHPGTSRCLI